MTPLLALVLAGAASADTGAVFRPEIHLQADGSVVGRAVLDADVDDVLAVLADGAAVAAWSPSVTDAVVVASGTCETLDITLRGWIFPMHVVGRRCPTADGFTLTRVESDVFRRWGGTWSARPTSEGTEVRYHLYAELALPVSTSFVQGRTAASMRVELAALAEAVEHGR